MVLLQAAEAASRFWDVRVVDVGMLVGVGTALGAYVLDKRKDGRAKVEAAAAQVKMHTENRERLDHLISFRESQEELNRQREAQVVALQTLGATTAASLEAIGRDVHRRLEMVEDELRDRRMRQ